MKKLIRPELLAPAGSPLALRAAIEGGADAVYMGGAAFNARINAKNFTPDELKDAISLAHSYGVKVYITANTMIFDREREDFLRAAELAYLAGADALIVADIGMACELKKRIPIELHASTQMSGHNVEAAKLLSQAGFSRMVCAREMSRADIADFCKNSPIEAEVFVHGALCVSTSGQCLFSSIGGGRSGNRGECAQPCRLPYTVGKNKNAYPLSLRDLSLAGYVTELCDAGVASLKIEGRMKSPEYVRDVVSIWRRLLDERRNASKEDMAQLAAIFSRGGFTQGYYTKKIDSSMLGVRSDSDKKQSAELVRFDGITKKIDIEMSASIKKDAPISLTATCGGKSVTAYGATPEAAINAPLSEEVVRRNLSKLGGTPYRLADLALELDEGLMLPISALNALRRDAIEKLSQEESVRSENDLTRRKFDSPEQVRDGYRSAVFYDASQIPDEAFDFFDDIFVPLEDAKEGLGVMLPEVIFDSQRASVEAMLKAARERGATKALVGNLGHIELARAAGFTLVGDFRLNLANGSSVAETEKFGFERVILSPELTLSQLRDIKARSSAVVYGRLPLMLTEKCVGKELGGCDTCRANRTALTDRMGVSFPVRQRFGHRSVIFNSVPVYMADRQSELLRNGITAWHFIFSTESKKQAAGVIDAYKNAQAPTTTVRRIK